MGRLLTYKGIKCVFKCDPNAKLVIYLLTFPNGKKYIGQTVQTLRVRMAQHCSDATIKGRQWNVLKCRAMRKYKYFEVSIIEHCRSADELNKREAEIILEYYERGAELYNVASGGLNNCEYFGKPCVVTDLEFNTLEEFDKIVEARDWMGVMGGEVSTLNRYIKISGRYYLFDKENYLRRSPAEHLRERERQEVERKRLRTKRPKKESAAVIHYNVVQISHRHEFIKVWDIKETEKEFGMLVRYRADEASEYKHAYGYYWLKEDQYNELLFRSEVRLSDILTGLDWIYKIDLKGNIIDEQPTIRDMAEVEGVYVETIRMNLKGSIYLKPFFFMMSPDYFKTEITEDYINSRTMRQNINNPIQVREYNDQGKLLREYRSKKECARQIGTTPQRISQAITTGKPYRERIYRSACGV